jgi:hypothetical protein
MFRAVFRSLCDVAFLRCVGSVYRRLLACGRPYLLAMARFNVVGPRAAPFAH